MTIKESNKLTCEYCKKSLKKNWYKLSGTNYYFCTLKCLEKFEEKENRNIYK